MSCCAANVPDVVSSNNTGRWFLPRTARRYTPQARIAQHFNPGYDPIPSDEADQLQPLRSGPELGGGASNLMAAY